MADLEKHDRVVGGNAFLSAEEDKLLDGVTLLDFDMLCSTVAMQTQGKWAKLETTEDATTGPEFGGVFRMWEGELLDCYDDRRIAIESAWLDFLNRPFLFSVQLFFRVFLLGSYINCSFFLFFFFLFYARSSKVFFPPSFCFSLLGRGEGRSDFFLGWVFSAQ